MHVSIHVNMHVSAVCSTNPKKGIPTVQKSGQENIYKQAFDKYMKVVAYFIRTFGIEIIVWRQK